MEHALRHLPATLDATYERILTSIEDVYREEAIVLLRWLAYAQSPPSLGELAEAAVIDPSGDGFVDTANRGALEDTLEILCGLVTYQGQRTRTERKQPATKRQKKEVKVRKLENWTRSVLAEVAEYLNHGSVEILRSDSPTSR